MFYFAHQYYIQQWNSESMPLHFSSIGFTSKLGVPGLVTQHCSLSHFHRAGSGIHTSFSLQQVEQHSDIYCMLKRKERLERRDAGDVMSDLPGPRSGLPHWSASPDLSQSRPRTPPESLCKLFRSSSTTELKEGTEGCDVMLIKVFLPAHTHTVAPKESEVKPETAQWRCDHRCRPWRSPVQPNHTSGLKSLMIIFCSLFSVRGWLGFKRTVAVLYYSLKSNKYRSQCRKHPAGYIWDYTVSIFPVE